MFEFVDRSLVAFYSAREAYMFARTYVMSPGLEVTSPSCLRFRYYLRSNLEAKHTSTSNTRTLALFELDGGLALHEAFIDLPYGNCNLIFEVTYELTRTHKSSDYYSYYRASIDDIEVESRACSEVSKCLCSYQHICQKQC